MFNNEPKYIPIGTSPAGLCLTAANWQEVQVNSMAFYLDALLIKPGFSLIMQIPNLAHYLGWSGTIVLNASKLKANKAGIFNLSSPFDGSRLQLTSDQLAEVILHIKPDAVLLPAEFIQQYPEIWAQWNEEIIPFIHVDDLPKQDLARSHGVYFNFDSYSNKNNCAAEAKKWAHLPRYVTGSY